MARDLKRHGFPMPRSAFVLLLTTVVLAVIPHIERMPVWMWLAFPAVLVWRIQVFRQRVTFPGRIVRLLLVLAGCASVILHHGTVLGPDAGVALLVTAYLFKQLEMVTKRDAFLVVILSYFVLATEFLFSRSLYATLYVLVVLLVITATLVALNHGGVRISVKQPIRMSALLIVQSIPLMIALFFLFPRVGPLWHLNLSTKQNFVGLNDRMSPGDISDLARSGELAFRAEFQGEIPPMRERYWRAAVFDRFDGRTWHAADGDFFGGFNAQELTRGERRFDYRIILQPTGQRWLMAMPAADIHHPDARATRLLTHMHKTIIDSVLAYEVSTYPDYRYQADGLGDMERRLSLQLPSSGNEVTRQYAREVFEQAAQSPRQMIEHLLRWFREEEFFYTLKPPLLGGNTVDEFLFSSRRGYCAHYAGALVFMLRSVGIPARLVGGYHGGEVHPLGAYLLVHQYDAHAWVEVWLDGQGWVTVDPTAAVAPNRIEMGSMYSTSDDSFLTDSPLSPDRLRNVALFARVRLLADYIDYLWFKNVVSYNSDRQNQLFRSLLGRVTPQRIAALLGGVVGVILLGLGVAILLRQPPSRPLDRTDRLYLQFCRALARKGFERHPGEAPATYASRVAAALPAQAGAIQRITDLYLALKYAPPSSVTGKNGQQKSRDNGKLEDLQKDLQVQVRSFRP